MVAFVNTVARMAFIIARWSYDSTAINGTATAFKFVVFSFYDCERSPLYSVHLETVDAATSQQILTQNYGVQ
uniref:Uncharacterized protein n=1 Tax=Romanomermis culicivorax TaxID=13658 RepID=A0A915HLM6_ROMCU